MKLTILAAAMLASLWLTTPSIALEFSPPEGIAPIGGETEALRSSFFHEGKSLTALIPETQFGLTVSEYPTFFVYVPQTSGQVGVFTLLDEDKNIVYETTLKLPETDGIVSFGLPATESLAPLAIGKLYRWYFGIIYDAEDRSRDLLVQGWVQRIEPKPSLINELEIAAPQSYPALYADAGIWHEAIATLAQLRRSQPDNLMWINQWQELLKSEPVKLDEIAEKTLLESLSASDISK
ncbi:DUF928 domain-containing protein [Lyngbya aestuarii]|uniref:DUF928 domain-containing protein n=1 Tax=Lyngbya aestuarii TaxID=118322 RepID=UPI00403E1AEF